MYSLKLFLKKLTELYTIALCQIINNNFVYLLVTDV